MSVEISGGGVGNTAVPQLRPPSTERKIPPGTPANNVWSTVKAGDTAIAVVASGAVSFMLAYAGVQVDPPSSERSSPELQPAKQMPSVGHAGEAARANTMSCTNPAFSRSEVSHTPLVLRRHDCRSALLPMDHHV